MLDIRRLREERDAVLERLEVRGKPELRGLVDQALELDGRRRNLITEADALKAQRNVSSPRVAELKKAGEDDEAERLIREMRDLAERIAQLDSELSGVDRELLDTLLQIPNVPEPDVPAGGEAANVVLREWGEWVEPGFSVRPHWELGEHLGILDFARGAKVAGTGFPVLVGAGARLERALIDFMLDLHAREHGYLEVSPPFLVNQQAALGTGHLPKFGDDMYWVPEDGYYLVPTAEVPVTNLHAGELLAADVVPLRYVAYTPCFRREAGAHGKDTRGLIRLHQFDKVELVRFERPEASRGALEELTHHAEAVLQRLGLRYRVLLLAGEDLGFSNAKTYDLEVWAPGTGRWLEVSSCSLYTDYQARRADIRFRPQAHAKPEFVHTLNGSGLALPRTMIALLETYQEADGTVALPAVLAERMGLEHIE